MRYGGYYILNQDPTVAICIGEFQPMARGFAPALPRHIRPDAILEHLSWSCAGGSMVHIARRYERDSVDGIRRLVVTNTPEEENARNHFGLAGMRASTCAHIREDIYFPEPRPRLFDAVYTARLAAFKRFHLASQVRSLKILTAGMGEFSGECPRLPTADYEMNRLDARGVARFINSSGCGLALSAEEGVMQGSFEYLLCGVPVVSTPSIGGRDMYYNDTNAIVVAPTPAAVAAGVDEVLEREIDPAAIRRRALADQQGERYAFCRGLSALITEMGRADVPPEVIYPDVFMDPEGFAASFVATATPDQPTTVKMPDRERQVTLQLDPGVYVDRDEAFTVACLGDQLLTHLDPLQLGVVELLATPQTCPAIERGLGRTMAAGEEGRDKIRDALQSLLKRGVIGVAGYTRREPVAQAALASAG